MRALIVGLLFVSASASAAERAGAIALMPSNALGFVVERTDSSAPTFVDGDRIERTAFWLHLRGGVVRTNGTSDRGSQIGVAYRLRLGITPADTVGGDRTPFGAGAELELVNRAYTFEWPTDGMIAVHTGVALDLGGGHWWSDTARFSFLGGVRVAMAPAEEAGIEFDYTLVPYVFTGSPQDIEVSRTEHRLSATARGSAVGVGVWATWFVERARPETDGQVTRNVGTVIGVGLEWR